MSSTKESNQPYKIQIMAKQKYYPEEVLIEMMQQGEIGWLEYVNRFSEEWQNEFEDYCRENGLAINNESAEQFVHSKSEELEVALSNGDA